MTLLLSPPSSLVARRRLLLAPKDRPKERAEIKKKAQRKLWNRTDEEWVVLKTSAADHDGGRRRGQTDQGAGS